jgi:hypothetical protein
MIVSVRGILVLGFAAYCLYQKGYENGRIMGRLEARVYPQFDVQPEAEE